MLWPFGCRYAIKSYRIISISVYSLSVHTSPDDAAPRAPFSTQAYQHIAPLLTRLAFKLKTTPAALRIYDPYFCEGRARQHLHHLGFLSVHNRNEDCYAAWAAGQVPPFDVLVTNPPFSADHMERIHRFAVRSGKPWFLLVPAYVAKQPFYQRWLYNRQGHARPQFVGPTTQVEETTPGNVLSQPTLHA